MLKATR
jgi:hypothetical protein